MGWGLRGRRLREQVLTTCVRLLEQKVEPGRRLQQLSRGPSGFRGQWLSQGVWGEWARAGCLALDAALDRRPADRLRLCLLLPSC